MRKITIMILLALALAILAVQPLKIRTAEEHGSNGNVAAYEKALKDGIPIVVNVSAST